ncbi:MAG: uncharacterized protein A8A55_2831 [Amphiamblys sp. WSBS2006]|nr:MAG: uncharacterized protein A8A55_2831 [Amphiamblys sp. WSBS2006]
MGNVSAMPEELSELVRSVGLDAGLFSAYWKTLSPCAAKYCKEDLVADYLEEVYLEIRVPARFDMEGFLLTAGMDKNSVDRFVAFHAALDRLDRRRALSPFEFVHSLLAEEKKRGNVFPLSCPAQIELETEKAGQRLPF